MGDDLVETLAGHVIEREVRGCLQSVGVAISLAKGGALELGEIPEPSNPERGYRLVTGINDNMSSLVIIAIEFVLSGDPMLLHKADAKDGVGGEHLLIGRHDLAADLIVIRGDGPHLMFHHVPPSYVR